MAAYHADTDIHLRYFRLEFRQRLLDFDDRCCIRDARASLVRLKLNCVEESKKERKKEREKESTNEPEL